MAKDTTELLTELKNGSNSFSLIGKVKLVEGGFGGAVQKEGKMWLGVNSKFGVEISDGNVIYPSIRGGYMLDNPVLKKFGKEQGTGLITIPYDKRHNEQLLSGLAPYVFLRGAVSKDETGRPELKKFIDAIDFEAYLAENLYDGMDVKVSGNVEYSPGKEDEVYRNYSITAVYLNEEYKKNEEVVPKAEPRAVIHQTYVFDADVVDKKSWKKDFEKDGQVVLTMSVPQYISKRLIGSEYVEWKKVMPLRQNVYIKGDPSDEKSAKLTAGLINRLFTLKEGTVRELTLNAIINEGYTTQKGDFEISKDMQELINLGLISEEEVKKTATVRGSRTSELIFLTPATSVNENGEITISLKDDKYAEQALFTPDVDDDDDDTEIFTTKKTETVAKETEDVYGETENETFNSDSFESMFQ